MNRFVNFLKDVRVELSKVSWPTTKEMINYTLIVVAMSLLLAIFLGGLDFLLQYLLNTFFIK